MDKIETENVVKHADWRLPSIEELQTLIDYSKYNPSSSLLVEDTKLTHYWTATTQAANEYNAWILDFRNGSNYYSDKEETRCFRCVRDGENGFEWSKTSEIEMNWEEAIKYAENLIEETLVEKENVQHIPKNRDYSAEAEQKEWEELVHNSKKLKYPDLNLN